MVTYKNIRIPMKGGKTRLQRVQVLASGKYKFVKNLVKSRTSKSSKSTKTSKKRTSNKRSVKRTGKKGFNVQSLFKWIRLGAVVAPGIGRYEEIQGSPAFKAVGAIKSYAGIRTDNIFDAGLLGRMWIPFLATTAVTYGIPKLAGIIRKL